MAATTSRRYQRLLDVLLMALTKSKEQIDVEEIIKDCYGDDDGDSNKVFQELMTGVLDQVQTQVTSEITRYMEDRQVSQKLEKLEAVIAKLDGDAMSQKQAAQQDKESAVRAVEQAKLPAGVEPHDVVLYQTYRIMLDERNMLLQEISAMEHEVATLEALKIEREDDTNARLAKIQSTVVRELEASADLCSTVS